MSRNITVGIDVGTHQVKVVVVEHSKENGKYTPKIIGTGLSESKGLRHGYIINSGDVTRSVEQAVREASKTSKIHIDSAYLSIGGIGLSSTTASAATIISRADSEISDLDIEKVLEIAEGDLPGSYSINRKIINVIPLQYKIDGKPVLGKPLGLKGSKLEVKALFITVLENHLNDLVEAIEEAGIEVLDVIASPIAGSMVTLTKTQKIAGCVLANIGAETVSIVVFENNIPISLEVFPIGSTDITNDIALGLKISLEEAEEIKTESKNSTVPRKKLEEIISARLSDIFELIDSHLKKINRNGLLPAGIIITGGGSAIASIEDLAKTSLKLPSQHGVIQFFGTDGKGVVKDSTWAVSYGLAVLGYLDSEGTNGKFKKITKGTMSDIISWIKQFLP